MTDEPHDTDPLEGADIGESRSVREAVEFHSATYAPEVFYGTDRNGEYEIADVTVSEDEYGDPVFTVHYEGEVTKQLPPNWDRCNEPRTDAEATTERRKAWVRRGISAVGFSIPIGLGLFMTDRMFRELDGEIVMGEPFSAPTTFELAGVVLLAVSIALIIAYGVSGGFPNGQHGGVNP